MTLIKLLFFVFTVHCIHAAGSFNQSLHPWPGYNAEMVLHKGIYDFLTQPAFKYARPVSNGMIDIYFSLALERIVELDMKTETLILLARLETRYSHDVNWDLIASGIDTLAFHPDIFYKPDVGILNARKISSAIEFEVLVSVYPGGVYQALPKTYHIPCAIDLHDFPFDIQECNITYGTVYTSVENIWYVPRRGIEFDFASLHKYQESNEWKILAFYSRIVFLNRTGWPASGSEKYVFKEVHFTLHIQRYSKFYFQFILMPSVMLACVTVAMFWIPAARPDRTAMGMGIFGNTMLLLLLVAKIAPTSASMKLMTYFTVNIGLVVSCTIVSAVIVAITGKVAPLPLPVRYVFVLGIGRLLRITQQMEQIYPVDDVTNILHISIREWQVVAIVLDRMCFLIYFVCLSFSGALYFPYPKYEPVEVPPVPYARFFS